MNKTSGNAAKLKHLFQYVGCEGMFWLRGRRTDLALAIGSVRDQLAWELLHHSGSRKREELILWMGSWRLGDLCFIKNGGEMYDKSIANILLNGKKTESLSSQIRNKTGVPTLATITQYSLESPRQSNQRRKNKRI